MSSDHFKLLISNKVTDFYSGEPDFLLLSKYKKLLKDHQYFDFVIESNNCGFFYQRSLHLYSYSHNREFNDIDNFNTLLKETYGEMFTGLESFGQDLFGNQFCFDIANNTIVFFNTETGKREMIASDFDNWLTVLYKHFDYYIGGNLLKEWYAKNELAFNQRLCPKMPFVGGGEFKTGNLSLGTFPDYIKEYFKIATQVFHLPEGASVKIAILKS
jgi:hypothetical protein